MRQPATPSRRRLCQGAAALFAAGPARAAAAPEMTVHKTPWCGCCKGWITHLTRAGFRVKTVEVEDLAAIRQKHGIPFRLSSCHTGEIGGYFVEGHVPIADIQRLLRDRPKGLGIAVPGMPIGSPGMESRDGTVEAYQTLLVLDRKGATKLFARHG